jgi:small conductance mechanosensitive channel
MDFTVIRATVWAIATEFGLKILGAIVLWIVGRWLIHLCLRLFSSGMTHRHFDPTIILVIAILGVFGIQTTSFAALLAAGGVAIGLAWSGLLANFAAGVFLVILRPFRVGDFVTAAGVTGTISEIGLFGTVINTPDNIWTIVGNNKVLSETIQNFSTNAHRRVELAAQLPHGADHQRAIAMLKERLAQIPNVLRAPAPEVEVLQFTPAGPVLAVRPYTHNVNYWQVYFDTNRLILEAFGEAGFPVPEQHIFVRSGA